MSLLSNLFFRHRAAGHGNTTPLAQPGDAIINMAELTNVIGGPRASPTSKDKKSEPLFGPNIGLLSTGPKWTQFEDKKVITDPLTPDIVQGWIERSKERKHPTTTLQALVNLKRPTLRLSPLSVAPSEDPEYDHQHLHGLEFEFDCDAPHCGIYVHVLLDSNHPEADNAMPTSNGLSKLLVFEHVVPGGFGKSLTVEEGAALELGKLEHKPLPKESSLNQISTLSVNKPGPSPSTSNLTPTTTNNEEVRRKRRFTPFHFRKRVQGRAAGPSLAVVDVEPATPVLAPSPVDSMNSTEDSEGVKVIIRLVALDEQNAELSSVNEQTTYLHVVRCGAKPDPSTSSEDMRPWIVQVVKREATIGLHTLQLHEIYGLSSSSSSNPPSSPHTHDYPPQAPAPDLMTTASECLVCLSSPREVVLLPCRHLVACKACALNMVEFGAGGNIVQESEPEPTAATTAAPAPSASDHEGAENAQAANTTTDTATATAAAAATNLNDPNLPTPSPALPPPPPPPPVPAPNPRRRRRAKGWSCPVCRQPYTSLLRITTSPSDKEGEGEGEQEAVPVVETASRPAGGLPAFLRSLSARPATAEPDVERGAVTAAA